MTKVTITLQLDETVMNGLNEIAAREEFSTTVIENGKPVRKPLYSSGAEFFARIVRDALMSYSHFIPAIAEKRQKINGINQEIEQLLTPKVIKEPRT